MGTKFAVSFYSDAFETRIIFTSKNRTPTLTEFSRLVERHERKLATRPRGIPLMVPLGRLPATTSPTMPPVILLT